MVISDLSILKNVSPSDVKTEPFPHIVIKNALSQQVLDTLMSGFPLEEFDQSESNKRYSLSFAEAKKNEKISQEWKNFLEFHGSEAFLSQFFELFKDHLHANKKLQNLANNPAPRVERRNLQVSKSSDVLMEAQICVNTPVKKQSSVIGVHLDNSNKLFAGLLYLRKPDDKSLGGNLGLYSWNERYSDQKKLKLYFDSLGQKGNESLLDHVTLVKEVEYASNVLVLFPNSIDALHSVSPRNETFHPRLFVNFLGVLPFSVYQLPFFQNKIWQIKKTLALT